jgi:MarR family transcriptional regulator, lower aerobic nicotinate degradation pathway regulator
VVIAGHELAMRLRAAYWAMHRRADAQLARQGVTADQFVLLSILAEGDCVTQQEVVRQASSDPNTVRAMLVLLEGRGLVSRTRHPSDRRARSVALTKTGRQTYERIWRASEPFRKRLVSPFDSVEIKLMLELLDRIAAVNDREGANV